MQHGSGFPSEHHQCKNPSAVALFERLGCLRPTHRRHSRNNDMDRQKERNSSVEKERERERRRERTATNKKVLMPLDLATTPEANIPQSLTLPVSRLRCKKTLTTPFEALHRACPCPYLPEREKNAQALSRDLPNRWLLHQKLIYSI